jgi:hypothetical protein
MAHFAQLDANNIVTQVIVVDNKEIADPHTGEEDEILGIAFCKKLLGGKWVQTSYNGGIRKRYAGIGYSYNAALDAFVAPKPFASWVLNNESAEWEAPVAQPTLTKKQQDDGSFYTWDEETTSWKLETKTA